MKKKVVFFICVALPLVALLIISIYNYNSQNTDTTKIGVVLPLTKHEISIGGIRTLHGIQLAVNQYNENNSKKIELIIEDSEANPIKGVNAINKLILYDKVRYIIGDLTSGVTLAIAPIAEQNKTIIIAPGASNPNIRYAGDYIFRNWTSDDFEGRVAADYIRRKLKWENVYVLYIQNDFGKGLSDAFKENFKADGGNIVGESIIQAGQNDFRTLLSRLNPVIRHADGIYLAGEPKEMGYLIKQMKEFNVDIPIFSNSSVEENEFQTIAGNSSTTIYYTTPIFNINDTAINISNFVKRYESQWNEVPDITSAHGYDAASILFYCLTDDYDDVESVKSNLYKMTEFYGITGNTRFDSYGDAIKPVSVKLFKDKSSNFLETYHP